MVHSNLVKNCKILQNIVLPSYLQSINYNAFSNCVSLNSLIMPDTVVSIGSYAFSGCKSLNMIHLSDNLISIDEAAFSGCVSLTEVNLPDSLTSVGESAFSGISISEISFPYKLKKIHDYAFGNNSKLKTVVINSEKLTSAIRTISNCPNLKQVVVLSNADVSSALWGINNSVNIYGLINSHAYEFATSYNHNFYKINSPVNLKVTNKGNDSVTLSWDSVNYVEGYKVYRSNSASTGFEQIASVQENTYTDIGLDNNQDYY
ncbi:MAG: leucine-rich repeat protein [Lachnospiraceae bacterium]|nr:leucine-rich repeat protein [Lachnospiraceae bacterium]